MLESISTKQRGTSIYVRIDDQSVMYPVWCNLFVTPFDASNSLNDRCFTEYIMAKISRPQRISESTYLSKYYTVEGLIRLAESRMFYIVNDSRPDRPNKYCWSCGTEESSTYDTSCAHCNEELRLHKFLVAARWQPTQTHRFMDFFELELEHPGMLQPFDVFVERTSMMAVYTWGNLEFLIDRPSPLSPKMVLKVAQNALGVLAFLHENGIVLDDIGLHNFLLDPASDSVYFFDPVIREMYTGPVPENQRSFDLACLGETLRKLVGIEHTNIHQFLEKAREQKFQDTFEMGRELETLLNTFDSETVNPNVAGVSDVGLVRVLNEDNWGWYQLTSRIGLYIVADGMGGHDAGEVASSMAVSLLIKECRQRIEEGKDHSIEELDDILAHSFLLSNNGIKDYSEKRGSDMGTTMVVALVKDNKDAIIANVGDSRAYILRSDKMSQVSVDHSLVQRMVEQGQLTPDEARHHPHSNILMRTVGTERDVAVDTFRVKMKSNDVILLCSDGLWGETEDFDMQEVMNAPISLHEMASDLVILAHNGGGKDNVTHVLVRIP
jgi:PPM family protein phosphatase